MAPGRRSGPRMTRPATTSTNISPQPTFANTTLRFGAVWIGSDHERDRAAVAHHLDGRVLADLELTHGDDEFVGVGDRAVTVLDHDVVLLQTRPVGRAVLLDVGDLRTRGNRVAHRLGGDAERRVRDLAVLDQGLGHRLDLVD